eukprot:CAMPEP_0181235552 /NCGR_PEP_ID=MMETSP1096-20121128/37642_1 /TAXON_ID=156174 ORGANISM="Chrysochromulina ericina, Strain CCMP281" /NCGR_SAMPLE_ID=MMETSP1096 /ASSEMBLY_ACC=CAM_ASM_000453 /LENGTH=68 /DNA_ID=CAMNT_0023330551 /DNA_START=216 /DNA_END=419 /DNA_ORIENTATION=+
MGKAGKPKAVATSSGTWYEKQCREKSNFRAERAEAAKKAWRDAAAAIAAPAAATAATATAATSDAAVA